ncbi:nucleotidyltransferase substrate binding protein [Thermoanaerobacter sp. A7A]|uniref:nucleotidyltransferase substrate binding protein n=1 Tax=Thermoanaerobacter sp. A7A TaxID=1350366 RepID=UPI000406DA87|nr:nucleotidyltransferase substrate binding protein [Thermoanaerobacter sp. A7A]
MIEKRLLQRFEDFKNAFMRLKEAFDIEIENEIIIDGVIQRFEFTFELAWKLMKDYLAYEGIEVNSPRSVIRAAYENHLIDNGEAWIDMLMDRNKTSHIYDKKLSLEIYNNIKDKHLKYLEDLKRKFGMIIKRENK